MRKLQLLLGMIIVLSSYVYGIGCYDNASASTDTSKYYIYDLFEDGVINTDYWTTNTEETCPNCREDNNWLIVNATGAPATWVSMATNVTSQGGGLLPTSNISIDFSVARKSADQNYGVIMFAGGICSSSAGCDFGRDAGVVKGGFYSAGYTDDLIENEWVISNDNPPYAYLYVDGVFGVEEWMNLTLYIESATLVHLYYENGTLIATRDASASSQDEVPFEGYFGFACNNAGSNNRYMKYGYMFVYDGTDCPTSDSSPPNIISYYVLGAESNNDAWTTNKSYPVPTYEITPVVDIITDIDSYCRISSSQGVGDKNYTGMLNNSRNCTINTLTNHTCILQPEDVLITSTEYLYISCKSTTGLETYSSTSGALKLNILGLEENSTKAIDEGIDSSEISGATKYNDKLVYLANITNQVTGTAERVAVYSDYRWIFNLYNDSAIGLFNITPRIHVMEIELEILSFTEIKGRVSQYINDTYP